MIRALISTFLVAVLSGAAAAQTGTVEPPALGFVFDRAASGVRPLRGLAGAATLGEPLDLGVTLRSAAVAQTGGYLLGVADDGGVWLFRDLNTEAYGSALPDAMAAPGTALLSPGANTAALYSRDAGRLQIIRGLPNVPEIRDVDLSAAPGPLAVMAVSDRGVVLASTPVGAGEAVLAVLPDGTVKSLFAARKVSTAAFAAASSDALVADAESQTVSMVRDVDGSGEVVSLADGIANVAALAVSRDGKQVFAAADGAVAAIGVDGGAPLTVRCDCRVAALERLHGNAVFRLTEPSADGPMWLLDMDSPDARVLFVPAAAPVRAAAEGGAR